MGLILIGSDHKCLCDCSTKCIVKEFNSGSGPRCSKEEIEEADFTTISLHSKEDDAVIGKYRCSDGTMNKTIRVDLVRNGKVKRKLWY